MNTKPVAKSLHTVTVIVQVARAAMRWESSADPKVGIDYALRTLGLNDRPDPYGLAAAALKQLNAGA